jgi:hypothetical protein
MGKQHIGFQVRELHALACTLTHYSLQLMRDALVDIAKRREERRLATTLRDDDDDGDDHIQGLRTLFRGDGERSRRECGARSSLAWRESRARRP